MITITILRGNSRKWFTPLGWVVKKTQKTAWHHYGVLCDGHVTDAKLSGMRQLPLEEWLNGYDVVKQTKIDLPISLDELKEWLGSKIGTKYAFWQLIGIGFISFGWIKNNPFGKNKKYLVCHEFIVVMIARFLKVEIGDSDNYTFLKAEEVICQVKRQEI